MAAEFLFEGRANLDAVTDEVNQAIDQIQSRINKALQASQKTQGSEGFMNPTAFGRELARIEDSLRSMQGRFVATGQASAAFFKNLREQVRQFPERAFDAPYRGRAAPGKGREARAGYERIANQPLRDDRDVADEHARYLQQLRLRSQAMQLSIEEERERLRQAGVQNVARIKITSLVTEEARVQAEINAMEKIRAAQVKRQTQLRLRSSDVGYNQFVQLSGEGDALERATAARIGLEAEKMIARNRQEYAQIVGERTALEARRLAAEKRAGAEARPELRQGQLEDEAAANNIRERDNIRRRALEEQGKGGDIGRRFGLIQEAEAKTVRELQDSAAVQETITQALRENKALVEREVIARRLAAATRGTIEAEALAGEDGKEIRELEARKKVAKQREVAAIEAEVNNLLANRSQQEQQQDLDALQTNLAAREVKARQERLIKIRASMGEQATLAELSGTVVDLEGRIAVAKARQAEAVERAAAQQFRAAGMAVPGTVGQTTFGPPLPANASPWQRFYGGLYSKQTAGYGGMGAGAPTFKQFIGSRALNTLGFAVGGTAAFGAIAGIGKMVREAEELELQLNILEAQFRAVDAGADFGRVRDDIIATSKATGIAADEIAKMNVQFAGVFRTDGKPDVGIVRQASQIAAELAKIGNIPVTEIWDDLIAGARAFSSEDTAADLLEIEERLSNIVLQARNVSGVPLKESLDFIGRSGPIGQAAGLDMRELNAIGATLLQGSSVGGAALAEQFNRIITDFGVFSAELLILIQEYPKLEKALGESGVAAIAAGDASALLDLAKAYGTLDSTTQQSVIRTIGGRREGPTLAALFENQATLQEVYAEATGEGTTRVDEFKKRLETISETIDQLKARLGELGLAVFESGLAEFFKDAASAVQVMVEALTLVLDLFGDLNDQSGGLLSNLLLMAALIKTMSWLGVGKLLTGIGTSKVGTAVGVSALNAGGHFRNTTLYQGAQRLTPAPVAKGIGATRGFLAGSGTLNALAPAAAAISVQQVAVKYNEFRGKLEKSATKLRETVARRFGEATSRQALEDLTETIENIPESSLVEKAAFKLGGTGTPEKEVAAELYERKFQAFGKKQAEALKNLDDDLLLSLVDRAPGTAVTGGADTVRRTLQTYLENPQDEFSRLMVESLLGAAEGVSDKALDEVKSIDDSYFKDSSDAERLRKKLQEVAAPKGVAQIEELARGYQVGAVPFGQLTAALEDRIKLVEQAVALAREGKQFDAVLALSEELAKLQDTLLKTLMTNLDRTQGVQNLIAMIEGTSGPDLDARQAVERVETMAKGGAPIQDLIGEVGNVMAAYKQIALDRIGDAETEAEKLALLDAGYEIPAEGARVIAQVMLAGDSAKQLFADIGSAIGMHADKVAEAFDQAVYELDKAAVNAIRLMLQAVIDIQKRALERLKGSAVENPRQADLADSLSDQALARIAEAEQSIADAEALLAGTALPERGKFSEADRRGVLGSPEKDKTDPTALIKAQRDLQLALAGDDPVLAARIAIANAQTDYQYAEDDAGRISALAAQARGRFQFADAIRAQADAYGDLLVALSGDNPVVAAREAMRAADRAVANARNATEQYTALAERARARKDMAEAIRAQSDAYGDMLVAFSGDDIVVAAREALRAADRAVASATNPTEWYAALAAQSRARQQVKEAFREQTNAYLDLLSAASGDDPVKSASFALWGAGIALAEAKNATERMRAQAEFYRADKTLQNAIFDMMAAQVDMVVALAEQSGDTVKVAQAQLDLTMQKIANRSKLGLNDTEVAQLRANAIRQQSAVRDAELTEQRSLIDFQLQMGEITKGQAIAAYQALLAIPNLADEQRRDLILAIQAMRNELGRDFQFNLPSNLALPTLYEARRLNQTGGDVTSGGTSSYQDNRTYSIVVQAETNASAEDIAAAIYDTVGDPTRSGTVDRRY
jgi:hypothetical protein